MVETFLSLVLHLLFFGVVWVVVWTALLALVCCAVEIQEGRRR